jgi:hypothetical protein
MPRWDDRTTIASTATPDSVAREACALRPTLTTTGKQPFAVSIGTTRALRTHLLRALNGLLWVGPLQEVYVALVSACYAIESGEVAARVQSRTDLSIFMLAAERVVLTDLGIARFADGANADVMRPRVHGAMPRSTRGTAVDAGHCACSKTD